MRLEVSRRALAVAADSFLDTVEMNVSPASEPQASPELGVPLRHYDARGIIDGHLRFLRWPSYRQKNKKESRSVMYI